MRRILSVISALLLGLAAVTVGPATSACACSCAGGTEAEFLEWADTAFVGVVTDVDRPLLEGYGNPVKVTFKVERTVEGDPGRSLVLTTEADGASCGYDFTAGNRYKVFARDGRTSLCSGNELLGAAPEVPLGGDPPYAVIIAAVLVAGLAVGGLLVYRSRRRPGDSAPEATGQDSA